MPRGTSVPITPKVLEWAIENSGFSIAEVAEDLSVDLNELEAWTRGTSQPRLTQFKRLAELLKRPAAFFLLPEPPGRAIPEAHFRHPPDDSRTRPSPQEMRYLRETARLQRALSWIREELRLSGIAQEITSSTADVDVVSARVRETLDISVSTQIEWVDETRALRAWRSALESTGVFVFLFPMGASSCRGFSLWDPFAPAIAVNTYWNTQARIFTIFHELGHLLTRSNSICLSPATHLRISGGDVLERWCERFAATLLLPWKPLTDFMKYQFRWTEGELVEDLDEIRLIARTFKVSLRATTLRLIEKGAAEWTLYDEIPPWSDDKRSGGGGKGRSRRQMREDWYGGAATATFVTAMDEDLISRADVLTYLNVTDLDLYSIQERRH